MRNMIFGAAIALLLVHVRDCATPAAHAGSGQPELATIADELGRIRRVLEQIRSK